MNRQRSIQDILADVRSGLHQKSYDEVFIGAVNDLVNHTDMLNEYVSYLDAIPANLFVLDLQERYRFLNNIEIYLKNRYSINTFKVLVDQDTYEGLKKNNDKVLATPGNHIFIERDHSNDDYYLSIKRRTYDQQGNVNGLSGAAIPFTDMKQFIDNLQLTKSQQEKLLDKKDQFIQTTFHDIRGPLTGFFSLVEQLKVSCHPSMKQDVQELSHYLNQYLSMVDLVLMDKDLESEEADKNCYVQDFLRCTTEIYHLSAKSKGLDFSIAHDFPAELCLRLKTDTLRRVLMNLIANAIKFTNKGSVRLRFWLSQKPSGIKFHAEVVDTGIGIKAEALSHIFEKYYRCTSSGQYSGTGLGLHTCREALIHMGGVLDVRSTPGEGSVFSFSFPVIEATFSNKNSDNMDSVITQDQDTSEQRKPQSILMVDDDKFALKAVQIILGQTMPDAEIVSVMTYADLCQKFSERPFSMVFLDLGLPDITGVDFIRSLSKQYASHTFFVVLSGHVSLSLTEKCYQAGADHVLTKPLRQEALNQLLLKYHEWCHVQS